MKIGINILYDEIFASKYLVKYFLVCSSLNLQHLSEVEKVTKSFFDSSD